MIFVLQFLLFTLLICFGLHYSSVLRRGRIGKRTRYRPPAMVDSRAISVQLSSPFIAAWPIMPATLPALRIHRRHRYLERNIQRIGNQSLAGRHIADVPNNFARRAVVNQLARLVFGKNFAADKLRFRRQYRFHGDRFNVRIIIFRLPSDRICRRHARLAAESVRNCRKSHR